MSGDERVLVTGGSGFIAGHCIVEALAQGYQVRTTVRDPAREGELRAAVRRLVDPADRLEVVSADLEADTGWRAAASGFTFVLHVASPFPRVNPKDDADLVRPARDGALRVLTAARDAGVKRVVMTSSTAAVAYGRGGRTTPFTEADWSDQTNRSDSSAYERSKTIAERAAWDWTAREGGDLELVTICPGAVLGPVLGPEHSASIDIVGRLLDGSLPALVRFGWPLVDVRDVADLHLRAMTAPEAAGQRYLAASSFTWMSDLAKVLHEQAPALADRAPRRSLPNVAVRLSALIDPVLRSRLYELGKYRPVSAEKARTELHWQPRPITETVLATANSLNKSPAHTH